MPRSAPRAAPHDVSGPTSDAVDADQSVRTMPFVPVIPAGGSGTRLWPLSRRRRPKFLLDLTGSGRSLLQQTIDRIEPLADRPALIITGTDHALEVAEQSGGRARVLTEPSPRNSMPAIALAAAVAEAEDADAIIGSFAADHLITDLHGFERSVTAARRAAELGYLATLGITPTSPSTGFGYIEKADVGGESAEGPTGASHGLPPLEGTGAEAVVRFVEKPDRQRAEEFLATGRFSWNAGMFVVQAAVLLDALAEQIPLLAAGAREIAASIGSPHHEEVLERVWPSLANIAIDHALAEPLAAQGRVAVVPADFDWDDVGDFAALSRQLRAAAGADRGVITLGEAPVIARDARASVYSSSHRPIALLGVEGISVVETDDVLLVLAEERAQELGDLVRGLPEDGWGDLR